MLLYDTSDTLLCHNFPIIIRGLIREWYTLLKSLFISFFTQLMREFELDSLENIYRWYSVVTLLRLKQGKKEILTNFVTQFTNEISSVIDVHILLII